MRLLWAKPISGDHCLITVSACWSLWSSEDEETEYSRRYKRRKLEVLAEECGFAVLSLIEGGIINVVLIYFEKHELEELMMKKNIGFESILVAIDIK